METANSPRESGRAEARWRRPAASGCGGRRSGARGTATRRGSEGPRTGGEGARRLCEGGGGGQRAGERTNAVNFGEGKAHRGGFNGEIDGAEEL